MTHRNTRLARSVGTAFIFMLTGVPAMIASPAFAARPVVVELFTSQGCSSCPPADAYLNRLALTRPDVLTLDFHVDYWDRLGWHDPYSLHEATARQERYAAFFGGHEIYTPEMVVDGRAHFVGSDEAAGAAAIAAASDPSATAPSLGVTVMADAATVDIGAGQGSGAVLLVGYDSHHATPVRAGENGGETLAESDVVRDIVPAGDWIGAQTSLRARRPLGERVAVLVQASDGRIIDAARAARD